MREKRGEGEEALCSCAARRKRDGWVGSARGGYPLTRARRQGPWRLAPLPRQQVNGQAGSAGQGPDARDLGVTEKGQKRIFFRNEVKSGFSLP